MAGHEFIDVSTDLHDRCFRLFEYIIHTARNFTRKTKIIPDVPSLISVTSLTRVDTREVSHLSPKVSVGEFKQVNLIVDTVIGVSINK